MMSSKKNNYKVDKKVNEKDEQSNNIREITNQEITNDIILDEIEKGIVSIKSEIISSEMVKMILFNIDDKLYAAYGSLIQEVILDFQIYYLPFAPFYIRGLINRHGEPYSVIDLKLLFNNEKLNAKTFLVLRNKIDKLAILITGINKIVNISKDQIRNVSSVVEENDYVEAIVNIDGNDLLVLNIKKILEKISNDI